MRLAGEFRAIILVFGLAGLAGCATPPPQTAAIAPVSAPPPTAANLVGATPQILDAEFGQPGLLRVDGPAQVWLYHSSLCGLNLILYPDASGTPRVADAVPVNATASQCVASLLRAQTDAALESVPAS